MRLTTCCQRPPGKISTTFTYNFFHNLHHPPEEGVLTVNHSDHLDDLILILLRKQPAQLQHDSRHGLIANSSPVLCALGEYGSSLRSARAHQRSALVRARCAPQPHNPSRRRAHLHHLTEKRSGASLMSGTGTSTSYFLRSSLSRFLPRLEEMIFRPPAPRQLHHVSLQTSRVLGPPPWLSLRHLGTPWDCRFSNFTCCSATE